MELIGELSSFYVFLSPVYISNFYMTIFILQLLFALVDNEQNWPIFVWQSSLLNNWRVSFLCGKSKFHIQKIVRRVDETTHNSGNYFNVIHRSQSPLFCHIKIAV